MKSLPFLFTLMFLFSISYAQTSHTLTCATDLFSQPNVPIMHKLCVSDGFSIASVRHLPSGLRYDQQRHRVIGKIKKEGTYAYYIDIIDNQIIKTDTIHLTVAHNLQQPVPFMGWLSWNVVQDEISTEVVKTVADAMAKSGLRDAGYRYLVIDDLWHAGQRDSITHRPVEDAVKFPNGMREAVDYTHAHGLKFGIYSDAGTHTCAYCYGSYGFEREDAQQYADWGVDLLKYDYCYAPTERDTALLRYTMMGDALKATGRPIVYYMCEWGQRQPWLWGARTGASCWRTTYDTRDGWKGAPDINNAPSGIGILESVDGMKNLWPYSGVNRFNDADMMCIGIHGEGKSSSDLIIGKPGMTDTEYATQFALWCFWASPLTLSFDLRKPISQTDLKLLTNQELIAIDQDLMGLQAECIYDHDSLLLFVKELENGDVGIAATNLSLLRKSHYLDFGTIAALCSTKTYYLRDLCQQRFLPDVQSAMNLELDPHQTKAYRLSPKEGKLDAQEWKISFFQKNNKTYLIFQDAPKATKEIVITSTDGHYHYRLSGKKSCFRLKSNYQGRLYTIHCMGKTMRLKK